MLRNRFFHEATRRRTKHGAQFCAGLLCALAFCSCGQRGDETPRLVLHDPAQVQLKLLACAPSVAEPKVTGSKLEVVSASNTNEATEVRVRVTAPEQSVEFYFPAYLLSRGRWLINEQGRAYLIDESCRQFKLKDRRAVAAEIPPDGRVRLPAGGQFEAVLLFPRLFDETRIALLVYGDERLLVAIAPTN